MADESQSSTDDGDQATALRRSTDSHTPIRGRRWRRTDPALDEGVRQHLVDELMDARRAVKSAKAADSDVDLLAARQRVNDAKIGLGERGPEWWLDMTDADVAERSTAAARALGDRTGSRLTSTEASILLRLHEE